MRVETYLSEENDKGARGVEIEAENQTEDGIVSSVLVRLKIFVYP